MSQGQPIRPSDQGSDQGDVAIRYGDVFPVTGDLSDRPIAPRDASMMQSAESTVFGQTLKGGAASAMESAATRNEQRRAVGHNQFSDIAREKGVTVSQTDIPGEPGRRLVTESVGGQAVRQYVVDGGVGNQGGRGDQESGWSDKITIGEALEATARTAGNKPVEPSDAAAIQAAESTATGVNAVLPGGVAAAAQAAVIANSWVDRDEEKTKLGDVLADATVRIPADKEATRRDAERVVGAEIRNSPNLDARAGGVAATVAAAARLNEPKR
ncbi:late embryogenesis abundant protein D-34-like isoform X1 [Canna indica]|uniref:Late embryogenesis abundant protein D-34-like isoform X1 n=1 Tax=Canna indica TaxID=4628 RepID=A0AAQ3KAW3_9LILI|nr:late embryogenesis abundant protein D-34-like isoform X1 [Canna indica]